MTAYGINQGKREKSLSVLFVCLLVCLFVLAHLHLIPPIKTCSTSSSSSICRDRLFTCSGSSHRCHYSQFENSIFIHLCTVKNQLKTSSADMTFFSFLFSLVYLSLFYTSSLSFPTSRLLHPDFVSPRATSHFPSLNCVRRVLPPRTSGAREEMRK